MHKSSPQSSHGYLTMHVQRSFYKGNIRYLCLFNSHNQIQSSTDFLDPQGADLAFGKPKKRMDTKKKIKKPLYLSNSLKNLSVCFAGRYIAVPIGQLAQNHNQLLKQQCKQHYRPCATKQPPWPLMTGLFPPCG